jgi:hypothetical protein
MHRRVPILSYSHPLHFGPTSPPAVRCRFWSIEAHPSSILFYHPPQPPTSRHQVATLSKPAAATNRNISRSGAPLVTLCPQTSSGSPPPWNHITTSVASLAPVKRRHLFMLPTRTLNGTQHPSNPYYPQRSHPDPLRQHQWSPPPPSSTSTTPAAAIGVPVSHTWVSRSGPKQRECLFCIVQPTCGTDTCNTIHAYGISY